MNRKMIVPAAKRVLCVLLLLFSLSMTFRTAWVVSTTLIDSDTASELVLGEKLAREGGIMSSSWVYSTELQVVDVQIVYSLLFRITSDWSLVRFWGSVLLDLMLLAAFAYLARQARIPFNRFCVAASALMLPFSIPYGRIVLFHNYYVPHITFSFLIVGLYLGAVRRLGRRRHWAFWVVTACLGLTAFTACLTGVRDLMISILPLAATAILCAMLGEKGEDGSRLRKELPGLLLALVPVACGGAGYLVNLRVLAEKYTFSDYSGQTISMGDFEDLRKVLYNTFVDFGFQDASPLFSAEGLLGICGVIVWLLSMFLAVHTVRHAKEASARFLEMFWLIVQLVMACVFIFLNSGEMLYMLYLLPIIVWIVPALAAADTREAYGMPVETEKPEKPAGKKAFALPGGPDAPLSVHGLLSVVACLLLAVNGVFYTGYFRDPSVLRLEYTGLQYSDTGTVMGLQPVADYLKENGYTLAYASYWDAAVITELSDGAVKTTPVEVGSRKHPIKYLTWLNDQSLWGTEYVAQQKVAIVANMDLYYQVLEFDKLQAKEVASIGAYTIFELAEDPAALAKDLN